MGCYQMLANRWDGSEERILQGTPVVGEFRIVLKCCLFFQSVLS
jgi:hypothetical protein